MKTKLEKGLVERVAALFDKEINEPARLFIRLENIQKDGSVYLTVETKNKRGMVLTSFDLPPLSKGLSWELEGFTKLFMIDIKIN